MGRQVEYDVTSAIRGKQCAGCGNTAVTFSNDKTKGYVILHGHLIAEIDFNKKLTTLFHRGFESNVTKSRLNCVLDALNINMRVAKRNRKLRLMRNGEVLKDFEDGMTLSFN